MANNRDLIHLEEERAHLKYLLTEVELVPDFRSAIEGHLARVEKLIAVAKKAAECEMAASRVAWTKGHSVETD